MSTAKNVNRGGHISPGIYTKVYDRKRVSDIRKFKKGTGGNSFIGGGGGGDVPQKQWVFGMALPIIFS